MYFAYRGMFPVRTRGLTACMQEMAPCLSRLRSCGAKRETLTPLCGKHKRALASRHSG